MSASLATPALETPLVPDWQTGRVTLVLPTAEMYEYNSALTPLELLYAELLNEVVTRDEAVCLVPTAADAEKMARLSGQEPERFPVARVPDIWVRDFAPLAAECGGVKFRYRPAYSDAKVNEAVDEAFVSYLVGSGLPVRTVDLVLEGGNLVHNGAGVGIATEKVVAANRGLSRAEVVERLQAALGLDRLVLVPPEPGDRTGHVDGMLRFVSEDVLVINDYGNLADGGRFESRLARRLDRDLPGVHRLRLPYRPSEERDRGWYDARGNYVNFLMTRSGIVMPAYDAPDDDVAASLLAEHHPGGVRRVDARAIARFGGSLNCITWNHR